MVKRTSSETSLLIENLEKLHGNRAKLLTVLQRLYECSKMEEPKRTSQSAQFPVTKRQAGRKRTCTVPEPFKMTLRDETAPIQALYAKRFTDELLENQRREEAAHRAKAHFRAGAIPPSTFLPIYEQMEVSRLNRRQFTAMHSKEFLANIVKPFKFSEPRGSTLHQRRCRSAPACRNPGFPCADDFPAGQRIVESRPQSRSNLDETLGRNKQKLQATRTPTEPKHQAFNPQKSALRHRRICASPPPKFQPKIHRQVPDFNLLQRKFQQKMNAMKIRNSQAVIVRPFNLRTSAVKPKAGSGHAMSHQRSAQESTKLARSQSVPNFENYPVVDISKMFNRTTRLRMRSTQERRKDFESRAQLRCKDERDAMLAEMKDQIQRLMEEEKIKRSLAKLEKKEQLKTDSAMLKNWYSEKLSDLKKRVFSRPTLLERQKRLIAKQSLEARFKDILKEAGLDESLFLNGMLLEGGSSRDSDEQPEWQSASMEQTSE